MIWKGVSNGLKRKVLTNKCLSKYFGASEQFVSRQEDTHTLFLNLAVVIRELKLNLGFVDLTTLLIKQMEQLSLGGSVSVLEVLVPIVGHLLGSNLPWIRTVPRCRFLQAFGLGWSWSSVMRSATMRVITISNSSQTMTWFSFYFCGLQLLNCHSEESTGRWYLYLTNKR